MKDFNSYCEDKNKNGADRAGYNTSGAGASGKGAKYTGSDFKKAGNTGGDVAPAVELAKSVAAAMNGKSSAQVMRAVIAEAERGKREGRLTNADLDNFYSAVYPVLDAPKRKRLKEIIAKLKSI